VGDDDIMVEAPPDPKTYLDLNLVPSIFPLLLAPLQRFELPIVIGVKHPRHVLVAFEVHWTDGTGPRHQRIPVAVVAAGPAP
jgi:hypothetical protein